jgi:tRNA-2-methylthio-N6-dimethylallyladenosine synthase
VPSVRGRERSRVPGDVVREAEELAAEGYREITLLGQNVNSYGRNLEPPFSFPDLLGELDRRTAIPRIRFITSHPKDFSSELIRVVRDLPTVCEAVHLPLQAGGDEVLRRMNRGYRFEEYRRAYFALREAVPGVAITTDIIVGFPGETSSEYRRTLAALEELCFDGIFSFRFSPREGTPAVELSGTVPEEEKVRRLMEVQSLQREITIVKNRELIGEIVDVLVEGPSRKDPSRWTGRTRTNKIVNFSGPGGLSGEFLPLRITAAGFLSLEGELSRGRML